MQEFLRQLKVQRWDDHRYYHHSRINQSAAPGQRTSAFWWRYVLLFIDPAMAALVAWLVSMTTRQSRTLLLRATRLRRGQPGHPRDTRKKSRWATTCAARWCCWRSGRLSSAGCGSDPTLLRPARAPTPRWRRWRATPAMLWLALGVGGLVFRTVHLFFLKDVHDRSGLGHQNPHRPVSRRVPVPQGAAGTAARRVD